ncbi:MAG: CHAD domain-containing protein [Calothrix sp. MO_192.B10]|nr:CHAD domain-containing protein [Calothrix sp. MO_192.B10]
MTVSTEHEVRLLGEYAYLAIKKHLKKTLKWETQVKQDKDPEALHQMRVGMRRLRTAISRFDAFINLPKSASDRNIGKIARRLGVLRDIDVLQETLENIYLPNLPPKEQKHLQVALDTLIKQRKKAVLDVQATLENQRYKSLIKSLQEWLEAPQYQPLASLTVENVLPDLLLPEVSLFFLHPGWLVGTQVEVDKIVVPTDWKPAQVEQNLGSEGKIVHDLRKQAKRLRYQMELFTQLYGESYKTYIAEVKRIQEILGSIQDSMVLDEWLLDILKSGFKSKLPNLTNLLIENRYQLWREWQSLQIRYLETETKRGFHLTILYPQSS